MQKDRQIGHTDKRTNIQLGRQAGRQTDKLMYMDMKTYGRTEMTAYGQMDELTDGRMDENVGIRANRQTDRWHTQ